MSSNKVIKIVKSCFSFIPLSFKHKLFSHDHKPGIIILHVVCQQLHFPVPIVPLGEHCPFEFEPTQTTEPLSNITKLFVPLAT